MKKPNNLGVIWLFDGMKGKIYHYYSLVGQKRLLFELLLVFIVLFCTTHLIY